MGAVATTFDPMAFLLHPTQDLARKSYNVVGYDGKPYEIKIWPETSQLDKDDICFLRDAEAMTEHGLLNL